MKIKWNSVELVGMPKNTIKQFLVTLKNEHVAIMVYSDITKSWLQVGVGYTSIDNPVIAWAEIPKPFRANKPKKAAKNGN